MDITFISMHDLTPDARVLYASDSIKDVLGYCPGDVTGKSCFEYFHPDEIPFAKAVHGRGVHLDRAAMLSYCNLKRTDGDYVRCECVFTIVYSVIVACTSLYRYNDKSSGRAEAAPIIRRVFSSSRNDPRYRMLTYLSTKFTTPASPHSPNYHNQHEPRAALILNRFTLTLTIMYATHALSDILGVQAEDAIGRSFYECISQDCLQDAADALGRAKENDSIAYLRFYWRDPRSISRYNSRSPRGGDGSPDEVSTPTSSAAGGTPPHHQSSESGSDNDSVDTPQSSISGAVSATLPQDEIEVEAVVSCTSDGLVVIVRRAQHASLVPAIPRHNRGVFASPWARAPLVPENQQSQDPQADFMNSIRQVAVFAWSLRSINSDVTAIHAKPGPLPDSAEKVTVFGNPATSTHWKRVREWESVLDNDDRATGGVPIHPQYPTSTGKQRGDDEHTNKRPRG